MGDQEDRGEPHQGPFRVRDGEFRGSHRERDLAPELQRDKLQRLVPVGGRGEHYGGPGPGFNSGEPGLQDRPDRIPGGKRGGRPWRH